MTSQSIIYYNGDIYTVDRSFSRVSVLAIASGTIVYTGNHISEAQELLGEKAEMVDLKGQTVLPGLIDSHLHFLTLGQGLSEIDIFLKSKEEILALVAEEAARLEPGQWIVGRGWNHEIWEDCRWPSKEELDAVSFGHPAVLTRADAHSVWANSLALQAVGVNADSPDPQGGEIHRDHNGEPTGILIDTAMYALWTAPPPLTENQTIKAYLKAQEELFRLGITSIGDAWITQENFEILQKIRASGELKVRVYAMLCTEGLDAAGQDIIRPLHDPEGRLSLAAYKIVGDGSLGSRSAWLHRDYADRPGHKGNGRYSDEELCRMLDKAITLGWQPCVHAIGDAAVSQVVRVMEQILEKRPHHDHRYRIEHFQIVEPQDLKKALKLGILPAMQSVHASSDKEMAHRRLDTTTLAHAYPWRSILANGGFFANGSDAPMDMLNPFLGFYAALEDPARSISREEVLRSYTIWAAHAEFAEQRKGSLEPGKVADFIILNQNPLECPLEEIANTKVLATVIHGENVWNISPQ